ncbi:hypothetical protein LSH36_40g11025 [Paralvinella palmiformis]|uniref:IRF tryptophan pentad repeat domain-containing protein n=1 Tax=Paralvinella palmiformis TaxID=53620 RepID=A0AAD9K7D9_9ANNE|nr:hypothetical protein LSH36_40g11025 [Paralvinella palmiformis]
MYDKERKRRRVNIRATNKNASSKNMATKGNIPKKEKILMRAWLVKRVEEGKTPGLVWHDAAHNMIRIPWVHGSRHTWDIEKHSKLFQAWAEHSGRYDGHVINPKRWKANFRCALNSLSDVHEVRKLRRKGQSAYKVYKLDWPKSAIARNTPDPHPKGNDSPLTTVEDVTSSTDNADKTLISQQEDNEIKTEKYGYGKSGYLKETEVSDPDQREIITSDDRRNQSENLLRKIDDVTSSTDTFDIYMTPPFKAIQRYQSPGVIPNQLAECQIISHYNNDRDIDKTQAADEIPMIVSDHRDNQSENLILNKEDVTSSADTFDPKIQQTSMLIQRLPSPGVILDQSVVGEAYRHECMDSSNTDQEMLTTMDGGDTSLSSTYQQNEMPVSTTNEFSEEQIKDFIKQIIERPEQLNLLSYFLKNELGSVVDLRLEGAVIIVSGHKGVAELRICLCFVL